MQIDPKAFVSEPELIRILAERAAPTTCQPDGPFFCQDDPPEGLYIFHEGGVTLSIASQSDRSLFAAQTLPSSPLGLPSAVSDNPYTLTVTAVAGAQIRFLSRSEFTQLMPSEPDLSVRILEVLAVQVQSTRHALD